MPRAKAKEEHVPTLINNSLHNLITILKATQAGIKSLQTKEKGLKEEIRIAAEDVEGGKVKVKSSEFGQSSTFTISLIAGTNRRINREKLLERGVSPEIIAYATEETEYEQVRISEGKGEE